jgi:hypothetical protein
MGRNLIPISEGAEVSGDFRLKRKFPRPVWVECEGVGVEMGWNL